MTYSPDISKDGWEIVDRLVLKQSGTVTGGQIWQDIARDSFGQIETANGQTETAKCILEFQQCTGYC